MSRKRPFSRIRRRTFLVTGVVLAAVVLAGGLLAVYAAARVGSDNLVILTAGESDSRTAVMGSGISIQQAPPSNLVSDSSFEPLIFRRTLTVYNGNSTTLTVSSEDASAGLYGDGFFDGATARVMTRSDLGLVLKKTARVARFGINRVGIFQPVNLPDDTPAGLAILAFVRNGEDSLAVGQNGLIISNVGSQTPVVIESGVSANLTGICALGAGYMICSDQGDLLYSDDGLQWRIVARFPSLKLRSIAAIGDSFVAVGDQGAMVAGQPSTATVLQSMTAANLNEIVSSGETFVTAGQNGTILTSTTGLLWQKVGLPSDIEWLAADYRDGRFTLAGSGGCIAISSDGGRFSLIRQSLEKDYLDIVMLTQQQLIVLDNTGGFSVSNDNGTTWLNTSLETGMTSRVIALADKDKIFSADAAGRLGLAQLVAEIELESALKEGQYQAGDIIFLEKTSVTVPDAYMATGSEATAYLDIWQHFGVGSSERVLGESSPGGGTAAMMISTDAAQPGKASIVSQLIDPTLLANEKKGEIYKIELWMKQSDVADRSVQVWLTGPFEAVGTTFTNVGTTWKKYSATFLMPIQAGSLTTSDIRINIAATSGLLWLDQVSFGLADDSATQLSNDFVSTMQAIAPQIIRLDFLNIGGQSSRQESWANPLGSESPRLSDTGWTSQASGSLHAALLMTDNSNADPWLVIDSGASQAELLNMIEYLAGPVSETYGKLRMDQGAVIPWTERFGRIIIEMTDSSAVFQTDQLKADFVNMMIDTISQSPYYRRIKSQLIFVDGMRYDAGVVLSSADYHASDLVGLAQSDRVAGVQDALIDYFDQIPRNPEKQSADWPEMMRTATLTASADSQPRLADLTGVLLMDLGDQTTLSNLQMPADQAPTLPIWASAATIAARCASGIPLDTTSGSSEVLIKGFKSGSQITIALANLSSLPINCRMLTDLPIQQAQLFKYDAKGQLIASQTLNAANEGLSIMPGGVILIVKTLPEK